MDKTAFPELIAFMLYWMRSPNKQPYAGRIFQPSSKIKAHAEGDVNLTYNSCFETCHTYAGIRSSEPPNIDNNPDISVQAGPTIKTSSDVDVIHTLRTGQYLSNGFGPGYVSITKRRPLIFQEANYRSSTFDCRKHIKDSAYHVLLSLQIELSRKDTLRWDLAAKATAEWLGGRDMGAPQSDLLCLRSKNFHLSREGRSFQDENGFSLFTIPFMFSSPFTCWDGTLSFQPRLNTCSGRLPA